MYCTRTLQVHVQGHLWVGIKAFNRAIPEGQMAEVIEERSECPLHVVAFDQLHVEEALVVRWKLVDKRTRYTIFTKQCMYSTCTVY